jgi:hypothetical protein
LHAIESLAVGVEGVHQQTVVHPFLRRDLQPVIRGCLIGSHEQDLPKRA